MTQDYWLKRWQENDTQFDQKDPNPQLMEHYGRLKLQEQDRVFVPLCGKSIDMMWLAAQGLQVVGVELSEIAIDQFFQSCGLSATTVNHGPFICKGFGHYQLLIGDFFALTQSQLGPVDAVYDRGSFVALKKTLRAQYARKMCEFLPMGCQYLLLTVNYDNADFQGPPHAISPEEVHELFGEHFSIELIEENLNEIPSPFLLEKGLTHYSKLAFLMRKK